MHRSGTSALARLLGICGATLPAHPMAASAVNPHGFFESDPVFRLHEELLAEAGTSWDDLAPLAESWYQSESATAWVDRMVDTMRAEFGESPLFVLKDPRLCRIVPFWIRVLTELDVEPNFVITLRNPLEVVASLRRAQGVDEPKGLLLWLGHLLLAERSTRTQPRSFVTYDSLLNDWRAGIAKIEGDLGLAFPRMGHRAAAEADAFLSRDLRHHASGPEDLALRGEVAEWVKASFRWASRAADGERVPVREMDRVAEAFFQAEAAFGPIVARAEVSREEQAGQAARLDRDLERAHAQATESASELERLTSALGELKQEVVSHEGHRGRLDQTLAAKERQIGELVETIKLIVLWVVGSGSGSRAPGEQLRAMLEALDSSDARSIPEITATGLQRYQETVEIARASEESLNRELEGTSARLAEAQRDLEERSAQLAETRHRLEERSAHLTGAQHDLEERSTSLAATSRELEERSEELARTRRELEETAARVAEAHRDFEAQGADLRLARGALEASEEARAAQEGELARLREEVDEALGEIQRLHGLLARAQGEGAGVASRDDGSGGAG